MKKLFLALFDTHDGKLKPIEISKDGGLDEYYHYLNCDTFDIIVRKVEEIGFDIFCDDEGLFKDKPIVSAVNTDFEPMLVGNLIFAHHNREGETTSITQQEFDLLQNHLICAIDALTGDKQTVLWGVD